MPIESRRRDRRRRLAALLPLAIGACARPMAAPTPDAEPVQRVKWRLADTTEPARIAGGYAPAWTLLLLPGRRIRLSVPEQNLQLSVPAPMPRVEVPSGHAVYEAETGQGRLRIQWRHYRCVDARSGTEFEAVVYVWLPGRELRGCGGVRPGGVVQPGRDATAGSAVPGDGRGKQAPGTRRVSQASAGSSSTAPNRLEVNMNTSSRPMSA